MSTKRHNAALPTWPAGLLLFLLSTALAAQPATTDEPSATGTDLVTVTCDHLWTDEPIAFETGDVAVLAGSEPVLAEIARILNESDWIRLLSVEAHTDSMGSSSYNWVQSQKRAQTVRDHLERLGVASERLQAQGFGETRPIASNETAEGRAQNRRVEFVIVERDGCPLE